MSRSRDLLPAAARACTQTIDRVPDDAWGRPSPCAGWSVRDVCNHLTAEHLWAPRLLAGETLTQVGDAYDGDVLGDDPRGAWRAAIAASLDAWAEADLARVIAMSYGPATAAEYADQMLVDLTVHAWDIATGAGVEAAYDPAAVEACLAYERPRVAAGGVQGIFGPPVSTRSADPLDELVALLGRSPRARARPRSTSWTA